MTEPNDLEAELKQIADAETVEDRLNDMQHLLMSHTLLLEEIRRELIKLSRGVGVF